MYLFKREGFGDQCRKSTLWGDSDPRSFASHSYQRHGYGTKTTSTRSGRELAISALALPCVEINGFIARDIHQLRSEKKWKWASAPTSADSY